ncbi:MAG: hypothetical protein JST50_02860 [Bacteroidetes bacterium]|jgi:hypothetical protein|nr:hypothetical protein [Bacteroidota bacterium]
MRDYILEKTVWTHEDFILGMPLNDCLVYAFALYEPRELVLDVDFIFDRVDRHTDSARFWVAPCSLVFEDVRLSSIDIRCVRPHVREFTRYLPRSIKKPTLTNREVDWLYNISLNKGEIIFRSSDYHLYVRRSPVLIDRMSLTDEERGGVLFSRVFEG